MGGGGPLYPLVQALPAEDFYPPLLKAMGGFSLDLPGGLAGDSEWCEAHHGGGDIAPRYGEGECSGGDGPDGGRGSQQFQVGNACGRYHEEIGRASCRERV